MWATDYEIRLETDTFRLLDFGGEGTSVLIIPPEAGHASWIADYKDGQSLVQSALNAGKAVYCMDKKSATKRTTIEDILRDVDMAVNEVTLRDGRPHLVGLCQGGWLAALYVADSPGAVSCITIAGTPIDTSVPGSVIQKGIDMDMVWYRLAVDSGGGVMSGKLMLKAWRSQKAEEHAIREKDPIYDHFYSWYKVPQDLGGSWYLWAILHIFKQNFMMNPDAGLSRIKCRINVVTGSRDDITPRLSSENIELVVNVPVHKYRIANVGHIGIYTRTKAMDIWCNIW